MHELLRAVLDLTQLSSAEQLVEGQRERLEFIKGPCRPVEESELEQYFDANRACGDTSAIDKGFVYLPVVQTPVLFPILSLRYDFGRENASLQAGVFVEKGTSKRKPAAFGYRYEQPEGEGGRHAYWHAQPIHEFRLHDGTHRKLPTKDGWKPADTPAFPLDAETPLDLLVCLMISLYGLRKSWTMQADGMGHKLAARMGKMRSCPPPPSRDATQRTP